MNRLNTENLLLYSNSMTLPRCWTLSYRALPSLLLYARRSVLTPITTSSCKMVHDQLILKKFFLYKDTDSDISCDTSSNSCLLFIYSVKKYVYQGWHGQRTLAHGWVPGTERERFIWRETTSKLILKLLRISPPYIISFGLVRSILLNKNIRF